MTAQETAEGAGRELKEHPALEVLVRGGLVGYGALYLLLGWMALQLAFGDREGRVTKSGALHQLAGESWGMVVLWAACIGFVAVAIYEALEAWLGHRSRQGLSRTFARAASAGRVVLFIVFAVSAGKTATGARSKEDPDGIAKQLMSSTAGPWLVAAIGVGVIVFAISCVVIAVTDRYEDHLDIDGRTGSTGTAARVLARTGYLSKGVAFGIVGGLFFWAAITERAREAGSLDAALAQLLDAPMGPFLLGLIAAGFACYGLFNLLRARHHSA